MQFTRTHIIVFLSIAAVAFLFFTFPAPSVLPKVQTPSSSSETAPRFSLWPSPKEQQAIVVPPAASSSPAQDTSPFVSSQPVPAPVATQDAPAQKSAAVEARIAYVADIETGRVAYQKNASRRWPLASLTKLMGAVIAERGMKMDDVVTIASSSFQLSKNYTEVYTLRPGDEYTVADLLKLMLLPSNNEAADALAAFYGRDRFIAAMNAQAAAWGMNDTHYEDPTGLSVLDQSTANDMFTLAGHVYREYPQILKITRTPQLDITELSENKSFMIASINEFAGKAGFIGGKTGFTGQAGENLASFFTIGGQPVFVLVMGSSDRFGETGKLVNWLQSGSRMGG